MMSTGKLWASLVALGRRTVSLGAANTWSAKQTFTDYTDLGGVAIKLTKLSGSTDALAGGTASVAHGLTLAKVLAVDVLVDASGTVFPPNAPAGADAYSVTVDATNVNVINGAAAVTILSQPFTILITHEE